ncbi:hypothetical protein CCP3SC15_3690001 [Gammaproteobacteria bacterium]
MIGQEGGEFVHQCYPHEDKVISLILVLRGVFVEVIVGLQRLPEPNQEHLIVWTLENIEPLLRK